MIKIYNAETYGWAAAIRGMRNPMNSWNGRDSEFFYPDHTLYKLGEKDLALMTKLAKAGSTHAKYRRMIGVTMDIIAPLYWWKEFDTYKVGTVANSCSTMHTIADEEFSRDDFSCEHLDEITLSTLDTVISRLNLVRDIFNVDKRNKHAWWQMIQLLPSSYNQLRTVSLNYEVLSHMVHDRKGHKLDEWNDFIEVIRQLPYAKELIFVEDEDD